MTHFRIAKSSPCRLEFTKELVGCLMEIPRKGDHKNQASLHRFFHTCMKDPLEKNIWVHSFDLENFPQRYWKVSQFPLKKGTCCMYIYITFTFQHHHQNKNRNLKKCWRLHSHRAPTWAFESERDSSLSCEDGMMIWLTATKYEPRKSTNNICVYIYMIGND